MVINLKQQQLLYTRIIYLFKSLGTLGYNVQRCNHLTEDTIRNSIRESVQIMMLQVILLGC